MSPEALYLAAMKIALQPVRSGSKGKDVLGPASPWKLNLYDDDGDGQWDRGKLDTNRDEVDDEKWNFKNGRWEKDGGRSLWLGSKWGGCPASDGGPSGLAPSRQASSLSGCDEDRDFTRGS